jgi:hypothetical protein
MSCRSIQTKINKHVSICGNFEQSITVKFHSLELHLAIRQKALCLRHGRLSWLLVHLKFKGWFASGVVQRWETGTRIEFVHSLNWWNLTVDRLREPGLMYGRCDDTTSVVILVEGPVCLFSISIELTGL